MVFVNLTSGTTGRPVRSVFGVTVPAGALASRLIGPRSYRRLRAAESLGA